MVLRLFFIQCDASDIDLNCAAKIVYSFDEGKKYPATLYEVAGWGYENESMSNLRPSVSSALSPSFKCFSCLWM